MELSGITEKIILFLKEKIISCEYAPGQRLNEIEVAEELGVSRTPIREAIRVLAEQKLLVNLPRKGTYVTEISSADLEHLFLSRFMIERQAIELVARSTAFPQHIRRLEALLDETERFMASMGPLEYNARHKDITRLFQDFHLILVNCAKNPWIENFYSIITPAITRYFHIYFKSIENSKRSIDNHRLILTLLGQGETEASIEALSQHINYSFKRINDHIFLNCNSMNLAVDSSLLTNNIDKIVH